MEGSSREASIRQTVSGYPLTSGTIFQFNQGWRNCDKGPGVDKTSLDLAHALNNVFETALSRGMNRIIVLEDDCEFVDGKIADPRVVQSITDYVRRNNPGVFNFGSPLYVANPISQILDDNLKVRMSASTHCVYYSRDYMEHYMKRYSTGKVTSTDKEFAFYNDVHVRKIPVAAQPFPVTENMAAWSLDWPQPLRKPIDLLIPYFLSFTGADKDARSMNNLLFLTWLPPLLGVLMAYFLYRILV
jgi:hypothetical protein